MPPWKLSPVFVYECALGARRWQTYAGRTAFLGTLLVSLTVAWAGRFPDGQRVLSRNALAAVGEAFFFAVVGTQFVLVLLAAPAYTAGSVCLDRARGTLAHMLVTELSAGEIVLGKLASRALPVCGLVLAGLPVMVLATLLGGIEPGAMIGGFVVTLAVALVSCTVALTLSVWGNRPHEVLLATYLVEIVWLLALPVWHWLRLSWGLGPPPPLLETLNPFTLLFAPYLSPGGATVLDYTLFAGGCAALSAALTLVAVLTLRRAALRDGPGTARRRRRSPRALAFGPSLDFNPVLWRECRRRLPSPWLRVIWGVYALLSVAATAAALATGGSGSEAPALVNAFQFAIGLLLVGVSSVASLFEERVNGSLDVLLTTPLSTGSIVWGKWWASYRGVVLVALLPALLAFADCLLHVKRGGRDGGGGLVLLFPLMLAYGALVNSLGLALGTWVRRFGVAVGLTVAAYVLLAAGPFFLLLATGHYSNDMRGFASLSPWYGVGETTAGITMGLTNHNEGWKLFWFFGYAGAAFALAVATRQTFDRCIGRAGKDRRPRKDTKKRHI